jgi:hypothetical protein
MEGCSGAPAGSRAVARSTTRGWQLVGAHEPERQFRCHGDRRSKMRLVLSALVGTYRIEVWQRDLDVYEPPPHHA